MMQKRGQVAIFVLIALVIVAAVLVYLLIPKTLTAKQEAVSPVLYLQSCVEPEVKRAVEMLAKGAGYARPEGVVEYHGEQYKYVCYTQEHYKTCVVQQPMLKEHFEQELSVLVQPQAERCLEQLKRVYEEKGYAVSLGKADTQTTINPGNIQVKLLSPMTFSKETKLAFNGFDVELQSGLYYLLMIAQSIIDYESTLGDSETTLYLRYYPNLKIEKIKIHDGSKIYRLENVLTHETLRFASRSRVFPPGYGVE